MSRTTDGLCNCLNTVHQVLWQPDGVHKVHYGAQFICGPGDLCSLHHSSSVCDFKH